MSVNCVTAISELQKFSKKANSKTNYKKLFLRILQNFENLTEFHRISIILQNLEIFLQNLQIFFIHLAMLDETFFVILPNTVELGTTSGSHGTFLFFC